MNRLIKIISKKHLTFTIVICFICYLFLKFVYINYGYIATEEGTLLYNQKLAYSGKMPFVDYDAWNSLLNDYFVGWYSLFFTSNVLNQRYFGLLASSFLFLITILISEFFEDQRISVLTSVFLAFGSYTFVYLSTIPYSELSMMMIASLGLYTISINSRLIRRKFGLDIFSSILFVVAVLTRIQFIFSYIGIIIYFYLIYKNKLNQFIKIITVDFILGFIICLPFFYANAGSLIFSFTWPLRANEILIYQKNVGSLSFNSIFSFTQEMFRDYLIFIVLFVTSILFYKQLTKNIDHGQKHYFMLLVMICIGLFVTAVIHKPPYATYLYTGVPFFSVMSAFTISRLLQLSKNKIIESSMFVFIAIILINNLVLFPHYKFMKTSIRTLNQTTFGNLLRVSSIVRDLTKSENDEVLSFYIPITVTAMRKVPQNLNRDRFSMSILSNAESQNHHLINSHQLNEYIASRKAKLIMYTKKNEEYFGSNQVEIDRILTTINNSYVFNRKETLNDIEDPKSGELFIYTLK